MPPADLDDVGAGLLGGRADLDVPAARLERARELVEVAVDVANRLHPDVVRLPAELLDVVELPPGLQPVRAETSDRELDRLLHPIVCELAARDLAEAIARLRQTAHASIPRASAVAR